MPAWPSMLPAGVPGLIEVIQGAGIGWRVVRTWTGGRDRERALKVQGGAARRCPACGVKPRAGSTARKAA